MQARRSGDHAQNDATLLHCDIHAKRVFPPQFSLGHRA
jgi:hypothetical protein